MHKQLTMVVVVAGLFGTTVPTAWAQTQGSLCEAESVVSNLGLLLMANRTPYFHPGGDEWRQCLLTESGDGTYWILGEDRFVSNECGGVVVPPPPPLDDGRWERCELGPMQGPQDVRNLLSGRAESRRSYMELYARAWGLDMAAMQEEMRQEACPDAEDWEACESRLNTLRYRVIRVGR